MAVPEVILFRKGTVSHHIIKAWTHKTRNVASPHLSHPGKGDYLGVLLAQV